MPADETDKEDLFTICVEKSYVDAARNLLDIWESLHKDAKGEIIVLPDQADTRDIRISSIRTELMSGEGPDLFIMTTSPVYKMEALNNLFPYPEKNMYSDSFLPLDEFLAHTEYAHPENWNETILKAGKTEEGQMILPLQYDFMKFGYDQEEISEEDIPLSFDDLSKSDNDTIRKSMYLSAYGFTSVLGKYADYQNGSLRYSKEELISLLDQVTEYILAEEAKNDSGEKHYLTGATDSFFQGMLDQEKTMTITGFPNTEGGISVYIPSYVAVNRNTRHKDEAFSFLDLMFSDEALQGKSVQVGENVKDSILFYSLTMHTLDKGHLKAKCPKLSEADLAKVEALEKRINAVNFSTDLEQDLEDLCFEYLISVHEGKDETARKELVDEAYERILMKIKE